MRVGFIGNGTLANEIARHISAVMPDFRISGVLVREVVDPALHTTDLEAFLRRPHDVVIECASQAALRQFGIAVLKAGFSLVPASIGALADDQFAKDLRAGAVVGKSQLRLPSGAIGGIDALAAAKHSGLEDVLYRGVMPRSSLAGFYKGHLPEHGMVFSGSAREAVAEFPKNANLTATIALAGVGLDATRVEIHIDDSLQRNVHELHARGGFGELSMTVQGMRISEKSPSSRIVAGSLAQAALGSNFLVL